MAKPPKPSMSDVARKAETSTGTVSRVLNGGYVASDTRQRIVKAMRELSYTPKYLANRRSRVCLYIPNFHQTGIPYTADVVHSLGRTLTANKLQLLICSGSGAPDDVLLDSVRELRPDVLVSAGMVPECLVSMHEETKGIIQIGSWESPRKHVIHLAHDSLAASAQVVDLFQKSGHERIGLLYSGDISDGQIRYRKGFARQMKRAELEPGIIVAACNEEEAYQQVAQLATSPNAPTALMLARPRFVQPVLQAIHLAGKRVPHDISVIAEEQSKASCYCTPPLTTYSFAHQSLGAVAGKLAIRLLAGESKGFPNRWFPPRMIERNSVRQLQK